MATWRSNYNYRVKIPISGSSSGAQTDYTKFITVESGTGTNAAGTIYCQNNALNFPNDIRIVLASDDQDTASPCGMYRIPQSTSTSAKIWVKLPSTPASGGSTDYYLYYGYASAADLSSGVNAFPFFDDFEANNLNSWATAQSGWSTGTTYKASGSYGATINNDTTNRMLETADLNGAAGQGYLTHMAAYCSNTSNQGSYYWSLPTGYHTSATRTYYAGNFGSSKFQYYTGTGWADWPSGTVTASNSTWYWGEVAYDWPNQLFRFWHDTSSPVTTSNGTATAKDNGNTTAATNTAFRTLRVYGTGTTANVREALDEVWIRKYINPEPAWGTPDATATVRPSRIAANHYKGQRSQTYGTRM